MGSSGPTSDVRRSNTSFRNYGMLLTSANFLPRPLSALLEFTGLMRGRAHSLVSEQDVAMSTSSVGQNSNSERAGDGGAEVSIRIFGVGEPDQERIESSSAVVSARNSTGATTSQSSTLLPLRISSNDSSSNSAALPHPSNAEERGEVPDSDAAGNGREAASQRYDFQQLARWIEQALPFTILLLMVFIRQHLQGFFVAFWITAVLIWSNDVLRKQTALKHERKPDFLVALGCILVIHIIGAYWWCSEDALWRPLILVPPRDIPPFWDAVFIIVINDTVARQAAMTIKCGVLIHYKNRRGRNYRRQAQLLTLVEYVLLLYRALIPVPVWYRFFLNQHYGNLFSSLTTGLYLTFKVTSVLEKVQRFLASLRALSRREVQYGSHATCEEVIAAGDMCAICQEKIHAPISLRCKHIFCEDCVSEWFERERTCPLCRAVVKSAGLRSYGDGSTSLFIQLF